MIHDLTTQEGRNKYIDSISNYNTIKTLETDYLKPNISFDIIQLTNERNETKIVYLFNNKGLKYGVCVDLKEVANCVDGGSPGPYFNSEEKAIIFLQSIKF